MVLHPLWSPQEGRKLKKACLDAQSNPAGRSYPLAEVGHGTNYIVELSQQYVVLSDLEFQKIMHHTPKAKDPKCAKIWIRNERMEMEEVYIFKKPDGMGRQLRVVTQVTDWQSDQMMTRDQHVHEQQGTNTLQFLHRQHMSSSSLETLLRVNAGLCTVAEYFEKLHKQPMQSGVATQESAAHPGVSDPAATKMDVETEEEECHSELQAAPMRSYGQFQTPADKKRKRVGSVGSSTDSRPIRTKSSQSLADATDDGSATVKLEDEKSMSSKTAWAGGKKDKEAAAQAQVERYKIKLSITEILRGQKLGVSLRHAREESAKMPLKEQLDLNAHIKVVEAALLLSPDELPRQTKASINDSIDQLLEQDMPFSWPSGLQLSLWSAHAKALLAQLSSMDGSAYDEAWKCIRPYKLPGDAARVNLKAPVLCCLDLPAESRVQHFLEAIIVSLLMPWLLDGEARLPSIRWLCRTALDKLEEDLMEELEEELCLEAISTMQTILGALQVLLQEQWAIPLVGEEDVEKLRVPSKQDKYFLHVSNAMKKVDWYQDRLGKWHAFTQALKIHEPKLQKLLDFVESEHKCTSEEDVANMEELLQDCCTLSKDFAPAAVEKMKQQLAMRIFEVWQDFADTFEKQQKCKLDLGRMTSLLAEAVIAFPEDARFPAAQASLADILVTTTGKNKAEALMTSLEAFFAAGDMNDGIVVNEKLQAVLIKMKEAKGLPISAAEQQKLFKSWWTWTSFLLSPDCKLSIALKKGLLQMLKSLLSWVKQVEGQPAEQIKVIEMALVMEEALQSWQKLGDEMEARMLADDQHSCLGEIIRGHKSLMQLGAGDVAARQDILHGLFTQGKQIKEEAAKTSLGHCMENIKGAMTKSLEVVGLEKDAWDHGLAWNAGFEKLRERANTSLVQIPSAKLEEVETALVKVSFTPHMN